MSTQQTTQGNPLADFGPNEWIVDDMYQRYLADPASVDAAWHWYSGLTKNGVYGAGQTFYAQNYVGSFSTMDFTLAKQITLDKPSIRVGRDPKNPLVLGDKTVITDYSKI